MPNPLLLPIKDFFGKPAPPPGIEQYEGNAQGIAGLTLLLANILKISIYAAGLFTLINLLISGIQYIGSSGNPELVKQASGRIWISLLGLLIIAAAFIIAGLIGLIFFNDPAIIIKPIIPNPAGFIQF